MILEDEVFPLRPGSLVNVPTGSVHAFSFIPGTQGWVVTIASEMMDESLEPSEGLRQSLARPAVFCAPEHIRDIMQAIFEEYAGRGYARAQILRALTGVLLGLAARALVPDAPVEGRPDANGILQAFEALVEDHFIDHWTVSDYARELGITPTHLSRVTRAAIGQPASRLIEERMIREARRDLVYTNLPISRIAYALGYNDPAYFSRVFSQATGMAPRDFRERISGQSGES